MSLSDACFVDDLVSLLVFHHEKNLAAFLEMMSSLVVRGGGGLSANVSILEVLVAARSKGTREATRRAKNGQMCFGFKNTLVKVTTCVKNLGCMIHTNGQAADEAVFRTKQVMRAQARLGGGVREPRAIPIRTKIRLWRTVVRVTVSARGWGADLDDNGTARDREVTHEGIEEAHRRVTVPKN